MRAATSRWNWMRVSLQEGSASQIGLPCSAVSTGPIQANMSLAAVKLTPIELPSALMAVDQLGGGVDVAHQLVAAVLGSAPRRTQSIRLLDARRDLVDLRAHVAEAVGQRVGPG